MAEICVAEIGIEARHGQDNPIGVFGLVGAVEVNERMNNLVWTSSNISVAIVDKNGVVTAKSPGTATITAKTEDGGMVADCLITVYPHFTLDAPTLSLDSVKTVAGQTVNVKLSLSNIWE